MQVDPTTKSSTAASTGVASKDSTMLGKYDFLKLLMAQMRNQDPLQPTDDSQFISQLTQFSMLEELQEMGKRMATLETVEQLGQANNLVGRMVEGLDTASGETVKGIVSAAEMVDGKATISIGDKALGLADVTRVSDTDASKILTASGMIGREVTTGDASGATVTGTVKSVQVESGRVMLDLGNGKVPIENLVSAAGPESSPVAVAGTLIGKEIGAILQSTGQYVTGVVQSAKLEDGEVVLSVGGRNVRLGEVTTVTDE